MRGLYDLDAPVRMLRMVVDRERFVPFAGPAERLTAIDIEDLNRLYQLGFRGGFPASVLDEGIYYGVRVRGRLVSAAGTHVINPREGIAVVGNVMTHADFRGHDFAKMVTSAVTGELLRARSRRRAQRPRQQRPRRRGLRPPRLPYHCELIERLVRRRAGGWGLMRPIREAMTIAVATRPEVRSADVADIGLADAGRLKIEWADRQMPVLAGIRERFAARAAAGGLADQRMPARHRGDRQPDAHPGRRRRGRRPVLIEPALDAGRRGRLAGGALRRSRPTPSRARTASRTTATSPRRSTIAPQVTMDDGADLVNELHTARRELLDEVVGGTEETTTGVIRLRAMANAGKLAYPVVAVNEALTKHLFDNRYGTGQSAIDGILRATNILFAGKDGRRRRLRLGRPRDCRRARTAWVRTSSSVEVDPIRALEAAMDGFRVMNAARCGARSATSSSAAPAT